MKGLKNAASRLLLISLLGISALLLTSNAKAVGMVSWPQHIAKSNLALLQLVVDQKEVLEKCMSFDSLQQYLPKDAAGDYKQLIVMQHAVSFDENNGALHNGQVIGYKSKGDIRNGGTDAYFYFNTFNIDANTARAEFTFYYDQTTATPKMAVVEIILAKTSNVWAITNSKINIQ